MIWYDDDTDKVFQIHLIKNEKYVTTTFFLRKMSIKSFFCENSVEVFVQDLQKKDVFFVQTGFINIEES